MIFRDQIRRKMFLCSDFTQPRICIRFKRFLENWKNIPTIFFDNLFITEFFFVIKKKIIHFFLTICWLRNFFIVIKIEERIFSVSKLLIFLCIRFSYESKKKKLSKKIMRYFFSVRGASHLQIKIRDSLWFLKITAER